ncbi:hypothetical protein MBLNU459_g4980t1 [Dothideomycetes sp. NU459]
MRSFFYTALGVSATLAPVALASTSYFNVTQAGYTDSSVYDYGEHINFNVADIGTGNTTYCALDWPYYNATTSKYYGAPSGWNKCDDNTFSWKLDNWLVNPTTIAVSMEIKHQYKGAGKLCVKSNGPQCSTTPPSTWQNCIDKTFTWKFDYFSNLEFNLELKHQYTGCLGQKPRDLTGLAAEHKGSMMLFTCPNGTADDDPPLNHTWWRHAGIFPYGPVRSRMETGLTPPPPPPDYVARLALLNRTFVVKKMDNRHSSRTLSLIVSTVIFTYHAATAYLCTFLPSDPLYVSLGVTGYAWYGCVLSGIGIAGSIKRSPTLLTIFSNHLLIDTVLSLVPKIGLLYLFSDLTKDLCFTPLSTTFWLPSETSSLHGPGRVIELSGQLSKSHQNCEIGLVCAQVVLLFILVLWTGAQWGLGLGIRRYALKLEMAELRAMPGDAEKMESFYEESLADGYHDAVRAVQEWTWPSKQGNEAATVIVVTEHKA